MLPPTLCIYLCIYISNQTYRDAHEMPSEVHTAQRSPGLDLVDRSKILSIVSYGATSERDDSRYLNNKNFKICMQVESNQNCRSLLKRYCILKECGVDMLRVIKSYARRKLELLPAFTVPGKGCVTTCLHFAHLIFQGNLRLF